MNEQLSLWIQKVFVTLLIFLFVYGLYILQDIVLLLIISGFLTIIINPLVDFGEKYRVKAWITVIAVFIGVFLLGSIVVGTLVPIIINYISEIIGIVTLWANSAKETYVSEGIQGFHLHPFVERGILLLFGEQYIDQTLDIIKQNVGSIQTFLTGQITNLTSGGLTLVGQVGGVIASWLIIIVSTFFMILERRKIGRFIIEASPRSVGAYLSKNFYKIQNAFTAWIKAMFILSISIFVTTYIGLYLVEWIASIWIPDMDIEKKFTLALISGIMEFIPYFGPLLALIPAFIIGLGISWKAALFIGALYLIIQRIENDILVPRVMSRALNLSPFLVFLVMLTGASLGGILGIILAVPIAGVTRIIYDEWQSSRGSLKKPSLIKTPLPKKKLGQTQEKN